MSLTSERAFNALLAQALDRRHPRWDANAEQAGVLGGSAGKAPDIVIAPSGGVAAAPVVIETEHYPARSVESDTLACLGAVLSASGRRLEQAVALIAPAGLLDARQADLPEEIERSEYRYRLARLGNAGGVSWFPETGWLAGSVDDLAGLCELVEVSETEMGKAAADMEKTVDEVSADLAEAAAGDSHVLDDIADALNMKPSDQTTKIGVSMISNALLSQLAVEGDENAETGWRIPGVDPSHTRQQVLDVWWKILGINYWPVFYTAHAVLSHIPPAPAQSVVLAPLAGMAQRLAGQGAASASDMAGQMFGKLITDRKFLAAFYTRRESARLLAELAADRLPVADWSDRSQVESLRIADLACGTGALLAAAYDRVASRVRRAGGDDEALQPGDDGERPDRRRHHARRCSPDLHDAVVYASEDPLPAVKYPQDALRDGAGGRTARRPDQDRLARISRRDVSAGRLAANSGADDHARTLGAQRRPDGDPAQHGGHGDNEPAVHPAHQPSNRSRSGCPGPVVRRVRRRRRGAETHVRSPRGVKPGSVGRERQRRSGV